MPRRIMTSSRCQQEVLLNYTLTRCYRVSVMVHSSCQLAIPQGHPPPTQLPAEFHGRVDVHEIIDSEFPGYVYLVFCYLLTENADDGKYNVVQCERDYVRYTFTGARWCRDQRLPRSIHLRQTWDALILQDQCCHRMCYPACVVCRGRHKPLIGQLRLARLSDC